MNTASMKAPMHTGGKVSAQTYMLLRLTLMIWGLIACSSQAGCEGLRLHGICDIRGVKSLCRKPGQMQRLNRLHTTDRSRAVLSTPPVAGGSERGGGGGDARCCTDLSPPADSGVEGGAEALLRGGVWKPDGGCAFSCCS